MTKVIYISFIFMQHYSHFVLYLVIFKFKENYGEKHSNFSSTEALLKVLTPLLVLFSKIFLKTDFIYWFARWL